MVKLTSFHVWFATTLLALAGCSKDEGEPAYGESTAPMPGASAGAETTASVEHDTPTKDQQASEAASAKEALMPEAEPELQALTDGQIVRIMETIDTGEIEQAEIALDKSIDQDVVRFSAQMVRDHAESKRKAERLAEETAMTLEPSPVVDQLVKQSDDWVRALKDAAADPEQFDVFYINGQVAQHSNVLALLEIRLLPNAIDEQLKAYLGDARAMVNDHLEDAKELRQQLTH